MEGLPEEADAEAYLAMPIQDFGAAMLRGMGWTEGGAVGRRKTGPTAPCQYVQRPHRLGLGAEPAAPEVPPPPSSARPHHMCCRICCKNQMAGRFEKSCRRVDRMTMQDSKTVVQSDTTFCNLSMRWCSLHCVMHHHFICIMRTLPVYASMQNQNAYVLKGDAVVSVAAAWYRVCADCRLDRISSDRKVTWYNACLRSGCMATVLRDNSNA